MDTIGNRAKNRPVFFYDGENGLQGQGKRLALMVKFVILFRNPVDLAAFEDSYNAFLAFVEDMPSITRRQVATVLGSVTGESPYYRVLEIYFDDEAALRDALTSRLGQAAGAQLYTFPPGSFETLFAEVYEEAGGRTETDETHADA